MHVIETVTRTGQTFMVDPYEADRTIDAIERLGRYTVRRTWTRDLYQVEILRRPGSLRPIVFYTAVHS